MKDLKKMVKMSGKTVREQFSHVRDSALHPILSIFTCENRQKTERWGFSRETPDFQMRELEKSMKD
ncbi:hypothetical protein [Ancylomarina subtilis]|uniref:hypothetical protein n=1 Tax=Ancylomarina subtilis TaxID=1639035 RepID=UPI001029A58E|nr:hypothetical protein [Ancylomarina subtilis]